MDVLSISDPSTYPVETFLSENTPFTVTLFLSQQAIYPFEDRIL